MRRVFKTKTRLHALDSSFLLFAKPSKLLDFPRPKNNFKFLYSFCASLVR
jgi:hypothetical protein